MAERVEVDINELFRCSVRGLVAHPVIVLNGYYHAENDVSELPEEVLCCSMAEARKHYPQLLNKPEFAQLSSLEGESVSALSGALSSEGKEASANGAPMQAGVCDSTTATEADGVFIYVPAGIEMERPIQIINLLYGLERPLTAEQRNYVIVGRGAKVSLLVCDHTITSESAEKTHFQLSNMTEVVVEEGAKVDYIEIESQSGETAYDNTINFTSGRDTSLTTMMLSLYGGEIRNNQRILFGGEGASCNLFGCYIAGEEQKIDNFTYVDHAVPRCTSNELFKGAMDGRSSGNFLGCIRVRRDAQKTEAYQANNNLLLSDTARVNTKPQLIIDADDVKCSHGATIGRIDEEAMFYLRSRGIGEEEARMMMKSAFVYDIIRRIPLEPLRNKVASMVEKRLRGGKDFCENCKIACKK